MANKLETNLNVSPYFDDYDDTKNFHKILFKPTVAVQARELTQIQTILQDQIQRHGSYNFKDGAIVDGCAITFIPEMPVVYLKNRFDTDVTLSPLDIDSNFMLYSNTGVRAVVLHSEVGFELTYPETNRFYLAYLSSGKDISNNDIFEFTSGEKLYVFSEEQSKMDTLDANNLIDSISIITSNGTANATGTAYGVTTSAGMIYQKGFFVNVGKHTIPVRAHDKNVNGYVIGFNTVETIVNADQDASLKSLAAGFTNYNAPGADRLKLTPTLVSKPRSDTNSTNFFAIAEFDGEKPTETAYNEKNLNQILDVLAERTFSGHGNYSVEPFKVTAVSYEANTQKFGYEVSKGVAYVNGYRVEKEGQTILTNKATAVRTAEAQIVTANFGNYVIVSEALGVFNFDILDDVDIYDTAQLSISSYEASYDAPSGTLVGKANVLGFQYMSGNKGSKSARYKLYLTNIRMNSGKSFSNDAKSFYSSAGGYGSSKADAVLESGKAVIKDADIGTLIFPFGVSAIKRLRDASGGNDTNFVFRDITSATMAANGYVTFTINSPANGGSEKLNSSVGLLSSTNMLDYNIKLANNAYSANLAGTVAVNTTSNSVTGTSTLFQSWFNVGDSVRINCGGTFYVRNISTIASNTSMTLDVPVATANTIGKIQKYFTAGHIVDLVSFDGSINVLSNTQFQVATALDMGTGTVASGTQTVYAEYPVLRSDAVETKKIINQSVFVKIDCSNNAGGITGPWDLGFVDVSKVKHVYVNSGTYDEDNDRIDWFVVNNGQKDTFYDHATISVNPSYQSKITSSTRLLVELDYFTVNTSVGVGFFSVDSYPIDDSNTANVNAIQTAEIPVFYSNKYGKTIDLRNSVDFRPRKFNTATKTSNTSLASVNPVAANTSFDIAAGGQYLIDPDTNFQADLQYYLPRVDIIVVNKNGDFSVRNGKPDEKPIRPVNENDSVVIAVANVTPYPSLSKMESVSYNRSDLAITTEIETVLRYTMEDIKEIDERIARLEYYVTLNLLEQSAKDMNILDENGLSRFKNGIFADSFRNHGLGKVNDIEYSIGIDKDNGYARPKHKEHPIDLRYESSNSSGVTQTGHYLTRPYTSTPIITQRFATDTRNLTGDMWNWSGSVKLYPSYDHYKEVKAAPTTRVVQDLRESTDPSELTFGTWRTTNVDKETTKTKDSTVKTTTTELERLVTQISGKTKVDKLNLGKYVTDVKENPFMRSKIIAFVARGMKPNTDMYIHFGGKNVNEHCAQGEPSGATNIEAGKEQRILNKTGVWGGKIRSNNAGSVYGFFRIPENKFRAGTVALTVNNVSNIETMESSILTQASADFVASSTTITTSSTLLITKTQIPVKKTVTQTRTEIDVTEIPDLPDPPELPPDNPEPPKLERFKQPDPLAQTFRWEIPSAVSGGFITKVGVYFATKDKTLGVSVVIMETQLGFPDTSKSLGRGYLTSAEISTSTNASVETVFVMDNPIFLQSGKEYAFMVMPDGNSPEYNVWTAKTGFKDIATNEQVFQNPYSGVLFSSSSASVWSPLQTEDMKFKIYRASFSVGTGVAVFFNDDDEYLTIDGMTKANTSVRVQTGDSILKKVSNTLVSNTSNAYFARGTVQSFDEANDKLILDSTNGNLSNGDVIEIHRPAVDTSYTSYNANTKIATCTIVTVDNIKHHYVVPRFASMFPTSTAIRYDYVGTKEDYSYGSTITVQAENDNEFINQTNIIASRSNEVKFKSGLPSAKYNVYMSTSNQYVSPVIDLNRKNQLVIENIINNDITNEHTRHGNAITKYISQNVVLDDALGNAEDLNLFVGAYRPSGTNVDVYVKFQGADDGEVFDSKLWTKMIMTDKSSKIYSSPINKKDFREFEYRIANTSAVSVGSSTAAYLANGELQYARSDGALINGFKTFSIKVVLTAANSGKIPLVADLRAIAMQK